MVMKEKGTNRNNQNRLNRLSPEQKKVDDAIPFNRQQEVGLYLLCRCLLERNTQQEIECQDKNQNYAVHNVIWFPIGNHI